jgi:hypothetical protein
MIREVNQRENGYLGCSGGQSKPQVYEVTWKNME